MGLYIFFEFANVQNDQYRVEIDDLNYEDDPIEVDGEASLIYPKVRNITSVLRGSRLDMTLKAELGDTWFQKFTTTVGDGKYPVRLFKNQLQIWSGFIKVDGFIESFVADRWLIQVQAIDGLGYLENTAFLQEAIVDGELVRFPYSGNLSELQILKSVLTRTRQPLKGIIIYDFDLTFQTIEDELPPLSADNRRPIDNTYLNTARFKNEDQNETVFNCLQVLESVLVKYGACVFQFENRWHIMRVNSFFTGRTTIGYNRYNSSGQFVERVDDYPIAQTLGSQIDGFFPHHASANQIIQYNATLGGYKVVYKYGFFRSILDNDGLIFSVFNNTERLIEGWNYVNNMTVFGTTPVQDGVRPQLYYKQRAFLGVNTDRSSDPNYISNQVQDINAGVFLRIETLVRAQLLTNYEMYVQMTIRIRDEDNVLWELTEDNEWRRTFPFVEPGKIYAFFSPVGSQTTSSHVLNTLTRETNQTPVAGELEVIFYQGLNIYGGIAVPIISNWYSIEGIRVGLTDNNIKGESHTVIRKINQSAIIDATENVNTGDNDSDLYLGGVEDENGINTMAWYKTNDFGVITKYGQQKILQILALDRMRMVGGNSQVFTGNVYGYLPYLCALTINNIPGLYMVMEHSHNLKENLISATFQRIFTADNFLDLEYNFELENDVIIRPQIND